MRINRRYSWLVYIALVIGFIQINVAPIYAAQLPEDNSKAVVLAYARIGEPDHPQENITIKKFQAHIQELIYGDYNIMSLPALLKAIENEDNLPPRTVALTFDGGYVSILKYALPLLAEAKMPFTVFLDTENIGHDENLATWDGLKKIKKKHKNLLNIGLQLSEKTSSDISPEEVRTQINAGRLKIKNKLKYNVNYISYNAGIYSKKHIEDIQNLSIKAAFGLHSGAIHKNSNFFTLPRFYMTENYADLERFSVIADALPLPAHDITPEYSLIDTDKPQIGFTIPHQLSDKIRNMNCFITDQPQPKIDILGNTRIEIRATEPFKKERTRVNCTIKENIGNSMFWRWFGMLIIKN